MPDPAPTATESLVVAPEPEAPAAPPLWIGGGLALFAALVAVLAFTLVRGRPSAPPARIEETFDVGEPAVREVVTLPVREPVVVEGIVGRMRGALTRTRDALRERIDRAWGAEVDE